MRLDARVQQQHAFTWSVWDCERCATVPNVAWADDETAQYGQYVNPPWTANVAVRQARRICFLFELRAVLINPLDNATMIESEVEEIKTREIVRAGARERERSNP